MKEIKEYALVRAMLSSAAHRTTPDDFEELERFMSKYYPYAFKMWEASKLFDEV